MLNKIFVIDVDGTMTDGSIYYDSLGNEMKKFNAKDAAAFFAIHKDNSKIMILTGRECKATSRRMKELGADYFFQDVKNKKSFLQEFMKKNNLYKEDIIYVGDDLNDYPAMQLAGHIYCPKDACAEIVAIADYISNKKGGDGAVRDVVEHHYKCEHKWQHLIEEIYGQSGV